MPDVEVVEVEGGHGFSVAGHLEAAPDDVGEVFFTDGFINESEADGPDFIEADAAGGGFDDFLVFFAVDSVFAEVWVFEADEVVEFDGFFGDGEFDFGDIGEEGLQLWYFLLIFLSWEVAVVGEEIHSERNVL